MKDVFVEPVETPLVGTEHQFHFVKPNEVMKPETLCTLGVPTLQMIAKVKSPNHLHPLLSGLGKNDASKLAPILLTADAIEETEFWSLVASVHNWIENGGIDVLYSQGISFQENESQSDYVARSIDRHGDKVFPMLDAFALKSASQIGNQSLQIFSTVLSELELVLGKGRVDEVVLRARLTEHLSARGYGKFCPINKVDNELYWGFVIRRGTRRTNGEKLDANDALKLRTDRSLQTEFILYSKRIGALLIHAGIKDAQVYASLLGEVMGFPTAFHSRMTFDLKPILARDFPARLNRAAQAHGAFRITLQKIDIKRAVHGRYYDTAPRGACLTDRWTDEGTFHPRNEVLSATLRIFRSSGPRDYFDLSLKSSAVKCSVDMSEEFGSVILKELGIWRSLSNA